MNRSRPLRPLRISAICNATGRFAPRRTASTPDRTPSIIEEGSVTDGSTNSISILRLMPGTSTLRIDFRPPARTDIPRQGPVNAERPRDGLDLEKNKQINALSTRTPGTEIRAGVATPLPSDTRSHVDPAGWSKLGVSSRFTNPRTNSPSLQTESGSCRFESHDLERRFRPRRMPKLRRRRLTPTAIIQPQTGRVSRVGRTEAHSLRSTCRNVAWLWITPIVLRSSTIC